MVGQFAPARGGQFAATRADFPRVFIYHTTKEGNFRGKNENAHEVDVIVEVSDGKATGNGRFGIGGEVAVF
jgi:hypothetical protein